MDAPEPRAPQPESGLQPEPKAEPEADRAADLQEASPSCPFCGSRETELYALFGSLLSTAQHYCRSCRTVFERIK